MVPNLHLCIWILFLCAMTDSGPSFTCQSCRWRRGFQGKWLVSQRISRSYIVGKLCSCKESSLVSSAGKLSLCVFALLVVKKFVSGLVWLEGKMERGSGMMISGWILRVIGLVRLFVRRDQIEMGIQNPPQDSDFGRRDRRRLFGRRDQIEKGIIRGEKLYQTCPLLPFHFPHLG